LKEKFNMSVIVSSVKLPEALYNQVTSKVIADGYGMRGRSKWIVDSIRALLALPEFEQYVEIASDLSNCTHPVSIRIPEDLAMTLEKEVIRIRKIYPEVEAIKSNIVRASIFQSLIREIPTRGKIK